MRVRKRIYPYVTLELDRQLRAYCAARGVTESAVAQSAIEAHLNRDAKDNVLIMRRLDRVARTQERHHRDLELLSEAFAVFVQIWFAHTPRIPDSEKSAAKHTAHSRYEQFIQFVGSQFGAGARLVRDVIKESITEERDLEAASRGELPGSVQDERP